MNPLLPLIAVLALSGCVSQREYRLQREVDHLKAELVQQQNYVASTEDRDTEIQTNCLQSLERLNEDWQAKFYHQDAEEAWHEEDKGQVVWRGPRT